MGANADRLGWRGANVGSVCALAFLAAMLQGCALYSELMGHGGALPLGDSGAEWSPAVSTPAGGAIGVQINHRF